MISLELFKKIVNDLNEQEKLDELLTKLLVSPDCNGFISTGEKLINSLVELLKYELDDKYSYIDWWLYDISDGNKFVYENIPSDKTKQIRYDLNSLDDLYYYICGDLERVKQELVDRDFKEEYSTTGLNEIFETWFGENNEE